MIPVFNQEGLVPPLDIDAADVLTGSEHILKAVAGKHNLTAAAINDIIKDVLKNPKFNSDEVDTDMLKRLSEAIDSGDIKIISMKAEGDGAQDPELFVRPAEKVLRELIGDVRLSGCQHFAFNEYKDPHGNRLFAGHANGSISFQLAQMRVGEGIVPVSIVLYIDGTFIKKGIPIRPVYSKYIAYRM
jgi:hypothetical protein